MIVTLRPVYTLYSRMEPLGGVGVSVQGSAGRVILEGLSGSWLEEALGLKRLRVGDVPDTQRNRGCGGVGSPIRATPRHQSYTRKELKLKGP